MDFDYRYSSHGFEKEISYREELRSIAKSQVSLKNQTVNLLQFANKVAANDYNFFIVLAGIIIFFIHPGLALFEAGAVKSKNATSIFAKNIINVCIASVFYWAIGYAFAFGQPCNSFLGYGWFFGINMPLSDMPQFFLHLSYAAAASSLVAGALAERCRFEAHLLISCFMTGFIYPVVSHWVWSPSGWLCKYGFKDSSGSGVVFLTAGTSALIGAILLGPRLGRFNALGQLRNIRGHSIVLTGFGGFCVMFALMAFAGASMNGFEYSSERIALASFNAILSGSAGGLTAILLSRGTTTKWSFLSTFKGILTAMCAVCAGAGSMYPWAAFCIGVVASLTFAAWSKLLHYCHIDDVIDIWPIFGGGGMTGLLLRPLFQFYPKLGIVFVWSKDSFMLLAWQLVGLIAICSWTAVISGILFGLLHLFDKLRLEEDIELKGEDIYKHGEPAYPVGAYGHGWQDELVDDMSFLIPARLDHNPTDYVEFTKPAAKRTQPVRSSWPSDLQSYGSIP